MREMDLLAVIRRKKRFKTYGKPRLDIPNRLNQDFAARKPNEKWVTDITEFGMNGQKVYLSALMDLHNNEIIAYKTSRHPDSNLVSETVRMAALKRKPKSVILHSDQGGQYSSPSFRSLLKKHGILQSMSRRGNCLDNACIESFFGHLKCEMWQGRRFDSIAELSTAIENYIRFYNTERYQARLQKMTPVEFGSHYQSCA